MERKEWYHSFESDREVILASTKDLSFLGLITCLAESILHPAYDNDLAGPRRPDSVCLHSASFGDDRLVTRQPPSFIDSVSALEDHPQPNHDPTTNNNNTPTTPATISETMTWCSHWFCVQQGWLGELSDARFLDSVPPRRRIPQPPNGQARRNQPPRLTQNHPRLHPNDFPARAQVLQLPYETTTIIPKNNNNTATNTNTTSTRGLWIVCRES
eukprot:CAMPEP_0116576982 /NCGR_PEP_ID=MMETSP0397-20121206/20862_1 /TAXON_ID=216820 /ORGANISM="Cyclophora tenuis, Strain ECT3854" /LENGTH=213 /DNA_ID=CAMNT_0004106139 /DNA_START=181 /DNA_END=819 /DNA_ORIENTATION=-